MDDNKLPVGSVLAPLLYFTITTIMAIILLVTALVMWIAEMTGSATLSTLIVGHAVVCAVTREGYRMVTRRK